MTMKHAQAECSDQAQFFCCSHGTYTGDISDVNKGFVAGTPSHPVRLRGIMVKAGELCLVTTLGLGLFHSHAVRNRTAHLPLFAAPFLLLSPPVLDGNTAILATRINKHKLDFVSKETYAAV